MLRNFEDYLKMGMGVDHSFDQKPEEYYPQNQSKQDDNSALLQLFIRSLGLDNNSSQQSSPLSGLNIPEEGKYLNPQGSQFDASDLMSALRKRESGGNYGITNSLGYSGAYQFGPEALEQVGLLRPGASKFGMQGLQDPNNWTIQGGREAFMSSPEIQDNAMRSLMNNNRQALTRMGLINESTPQSVVNGMLAAAHLAGPGGVRRMLRGRDPRDAYGSSASSYYKLGSSL